MASCHALVRRRWYVPALRPVILSSELPVSVIGMFTFEIATELIATGASLFFVDSSLLVKYITYSTNYSLAFSLSFFFHNTVWLVNPLFPLSQLEWARLWMCFIVKSVADMLARQCPN
jgi:hypothetical protein